MEMEDDMHVRKFTYRITCSRCNGTGTVIDKGLAVGTLGISVICGWMVPTVGCKSCPDCDGTGLVTLIDNDYEDDE